MEYKREIIEQISIFLENRAGVVADLCAHMTDRNISIRAITVLDTIDIGTVRMVVDDPEKAKEALAAAGAAYVTVKCLALEVPNAPGGFANAASKLSLAGINIEYIYASTPSSAGKAMGIFRVSDLERAMKLDYGN
ncbi:MAG: ACT domain-containing protein [Phycisphaerae bacterium]|nr:ACT domain-containing protein [Phycisphaerae bacterium]